MMRQRTASVLLVACGVALSGCTSSLMRKGGGVATTPAPEQAQVVFLRPSSFGGAVQASVFDLQRGKPDRFAGIVSSGTKVAYLADPGEHRFMVIGENADFMEATLAAGKTYYVLVAPRFGVWKARFSLRPVHSSELTGSEFRSWDADTTFYENTPQSEDWARKQAASIDSKKNGYLAKWDAKTPAERMANALRADDGR